MDEFQIAALRLVSGYDGHADPKVIMIVLNKQVAEHNSQLSLLADTVINLSQKVDSLVELRKSTPLGDGS